MYQPGVHRHVRKIKTGVVESIGRLADRWGEFIEDDDNLWRIINGFCIAVLAAMLIYLYVWPILSLGLSFIWVLVTVGYSK